MHAFFSKPAKHVPWSKKSHNHTKSYEEKRHFFFLGKAVGFEELCATNMRQHSENNVLNIAR